KGANAVGGGGKPPALDQAAARCSSFVMKSISLSQFLNCFSAPQILQVPRLIGPFGSSIRQRWKWSAAAFGCSVWVACIPGVLRSVDSLHYRRLRFDRESVSTILSVVPE